MNLSDPTIQSILSVILYGLRVLVPLFSIIVIIQCYRSMKRGRRREEPVVILEEMSTKTKIPVLYWENSIGRSKSCDIVLPDPTASRDHAVLMRRPEGWMITDTGSKSGTFINGTKIRDRTPVYPGDVIALGSTAMMLRPVSNHDLSQKRRLFFSSGRAPSPSGLLFLVNMIHFLLAVQSCLAHDTFSVLPLIPFGILVVISWAFYLFSIHGLNRVSFEVETVGLLLSGIGIMLLSGIDVNETWMQLATLAAGIFLFCVMIAFMGDLDRVMKWRLAIEIGAVVLFAINLVFGIASNGAKNWISIGPVSLQPSEFIKIAFIFAGASTLEKLQTKKNLTEFLLFSAVCIGSLFLMRDFGTALIFFVTFLVIAFMRSGSIRTIILICAAAVFGVFIILQFRPYIADRFAVWRHIWDAANINDSGMQQTRVLTYSASGGLFGLGLGEGGVKDIFAGDSDLIFGMLCEELGIVLAIVVAVAIALLILYARSDVTRSRSTFYSISACAAAGLLVFQMCLNIFGSTDLLPLTGVTLPFISAGGSSMISVWGMLAFIKASDERTYAARRKAR